MPRLNSFLKKSQNFILANVKYNCAPELTKTSHILPKMFNNKFLLCPHGDFNRVRKNEKKY